MAHASKVLILLFAAAVWFPAAASRAQPSPSLADKIKNADLQTGLHIKPVVGMQYVCKVRRSWTFPNVATAWNFHQKLAALGFTELSIHAGPGSGQYTIYYRLAQPKTKWFNNREEAGKFLKEMVGYGVDVVTVWP